MPRGLFGGGRLCRCGLSRCSLGGGLLLGGFLSRLLNWYYTFRKPGLVPGFFVGFAAAVATRHMTIEIASASRFGNLSTPLRT